MAIGTRVRTWVRPATFRRCFFIGLLLLGVLLAWHLVVLTGAAR